MAKKGFVLPAALLAAAGALAPLASASPALAASPQYAFTANAFGSSATVGVAGLGVGSGKSAYVQLSCTMKPQTQTNSTAGVSIPGLTTTSGAVTNTVSAAHNTGTGTWSDSASSAVANLSALGGAVQASAITTHASAAEAPGGATVSGTVTLAGLSVGGNTLSSNPAPNTKITVSGIGSVTLNAQSEVKTSGHAQMSVDAVLVVLAAGNTLGAPAGATIIIGHAIASVGGPVSGLLSGQSFGTSLSGNSNVTSAPTFVAYVNCIGGKPVTNQGAGVPAGPLTAGTITDTTTGTNTATQLSAQATSTIANAAVAHVLSLTAIKSTASASVVSGTLQSSGGITISGLKVLGVPIPLPSVVPPNTTVPLFDGTLILNRQVVGKDGMLVDGVYLTVPGVGTITIASASAYAS